MANPIHKPIDAPLVFDDSALFVSLREIGLKPHHPWSFQHPFSNSGPSFITAKDCTRVDLSYNFFRSFARLNQTANQLLGIKTATAQPIPADSPENFKIDSQEAMILRQTLDLLSTPSWDQITSLNELDHHLFVTNRRLVRERLNLLGENECWLGAQAVQTGLFGAINGQRRPWVEKVTYPPAKPGDEERSERTGTSSAAFFDCPYNDELAELMPRLSFNPEAMPEPIREAAESVVGLKLENGEAGAGFFYGKEGYILTARHLLDDVLTWDNHYVSLTFSVDERDQVVDTEIIDLEYPEEAEGPGLILLYVDANLPSFTPLVPLLNPEIIQNQTRVFAIGYPPYQEGEKHKKAVSPGNLQPQNYGKAREGSLESDIPSYPGNSGGPVVDSQGRVIGVMASLVAGKFEDQPDPTASGLKKQKAPIIGSGIYSLALWDPVIQRAIAEHEARSPWKVPTR